MQGRIELTPRGRVTLLLVQLTASAAWLTADPVARLATAILAAPVLVDLVLRFTARPRVQVRVGRRRTRAKDAFVEAIEVHNLRRVANVHALEITEARTAVRGDATAFVEVLPAQSTLRLELPARVRQRGIEEERTFELCSSHPFGMLLWRAKITHQARLVAEPARTTLDPRILERLESADEPVSTGARIGDDFFALREYAHGSDARLVHARRSASLGSLVTRDMRGGHQAEATIVVDLRRTPGRGYHFGGDRRIEPRLSLAATLLDEMLARQTTPTCIVIGPETKQWCIRSQGDAESFLDVLADARAVPHRQIGDEPFRNLSNESIAFWVPAGGFDAKRDRDRLADVVVVSEEGASS